MITATIEIKVDNTHTFVQVWGEGIALEIAEELLEIARNMDTETLMGIKVIKKQSN
jgi:predicted GNAT family acetyltransferase